MKEVVYYSNVEQTAIINELLGLNEKYFEVADVFKYLPDHICFNERTGYLTVSNIDIYWTSLELEREGSVVMLFQHLTSDKNIFDSFIDALKWIKSNKDIEIIDY